MMTVPFALPTKRSFLPALLLSLVLGAALALRLSPLASSAASADPAPSNVTEGRLIVPLDQRGAGNVQHHPASASAGSIPEQLAARPEDVAFCVGSALEPFDVTWAQLAADGADETAERTRRCLMELTFTHVAPAIAADVRAQVPYFSRCYRGALDLPDPKQGRVLAEVTGCIANPPPGWR